MSEPTPYEEPALNGTSGGAALLVPSYEPVARHQDGLGNEWFTNPHTEDGQVPLYEAVDSHQQYAQPFAVYGYVPTMVRWCEACVHCRGCGLELSGWHAYMASFVVFLHK